MYAASATYPQANDTQDCLLRVRILLGKGAGKGGFGHVGFTTVDAGGNQTHYDFGAANSATGKRTGCSMVFRAAAMAIPLATIALYSTAAMVTGLSQNMDIAPTIALMYAGSAYSALLWPTFGVLAKNAAPVIDKKPDRVFDIPVSAAQLQKIHDFTNKHQRTVYSLSLFNCVSYTKRMMKNCGIRIPMRLGFNTPMYLARTLEQAKAPAQAQAPKANRAKPSGSNNTL